MVTTLASLKRTICGHTGPIAAALLFTLILAPSSQASLTGLSLIAAGTSGFPGNATTDAPGTLIADETEAYSFSTSAGTDSGNVISAVFMEAGGTLDFYYQIVAGGGSSTAISAESNVDFGTVAVELGFRTDGSSLPSGVPGPNLFVDGDAINGVPGTVSLDTTGAVTTFTFVPPGIGIAGGDTSVVLVVSTDATTYANGNVNLISGQAGETTAFQPGSLVPEPASFLLLGAGLLAIGGFSRLRRR